jgi:hypothetical protein
MWRDIFDVLEHILLSLALRDLQAQDSRGFFFRVRTSEPFRLLFLFDLYFYWVHRWKSGVRASGLARSVFRVPWTVFIDGLARAVSRLLPWK